MPLLVLELDARSYYRVLLLNWSLYIQSFHVVNLQNGENKLQERVVDRDEMLLSTYQPLFTCRHPRRWCCKPPTSLQMWSLQAPPPPPPPPPPPHTPPPATRQRHAGHRARPWDPSPRSRAESTVLLGFSAYVRAVVDGHGMNHVLFCFVHCFLSL